MRSVYIKHSRLCGTTEIYKHLEVRQNYSAARRIFDSLLGVGNVIKHVLSFLIYSIKYVVVVKSMLTAHI